MYRTMAEMKEIDRIAIEERGIPSLVLMEHAAGHTADIAEEMLAEEKDRNVLVIAGTGNNGGDGLAAARLLSRRGYHTDIFMVGNPEKMTPDSRANAAELAKMGLKIQIFRSDSEDFMNVLGKADLIIDCIFGVGITREVGGLYREAVLLINASGKKVLSCDIPSGLNGDTGEIMGVSVRANRTVTFTCGKKGLFTGKGPECAGKTDIVDIGIPADILSEQTRLHKTV